MFASQVFARIAANRHLLPLSVEEWTPFLHHRGLLSNEGKVRTVCIQSCLAIATLCRAQYADTAGDVLLSVSADRLNEKSPVTVSLVAVRQDALLTSRLWLSLFDHVDAISAVAKSIDGVLDVSARVDAGVCDRLFALLDHDHQHVRDAAAKALAAAIGRLLFLTDEGAVSTGFALVERLLGRFTECDMPNNA